MRVCYVLPRPELCGGNKVVALHAGLLAAAGMDVTLVAGGPRPAWLPFRGRYLDGSANPLRLASQDVVIATFWTTLAEARRLGAGPVAHFCQGYEGWFTHLQPIRGDIEAAYSTPAPTLAVTPSLAAYLSGRFGRRCRVASPTIDPFFRPRGRLRPRRVPWIAVPGVFEADFKDVPTALRAVTLLREAGARCRVLRFAPSPLSDMERAQLRPDRYLHAASPREVARALRQCDLLLFASLPEEGFGLPLLEAMTSGVPVVASAIPSASLIGNGSVVMVDPGDAAGFAREAAALLSDAARWRRARRDAYDAAQRFAPERVVPELVDAIRWAAHSVTPAG